MVTINSIIIYFWPQAWPQHRKTRYNVLCFSGLCDKVVIRLGFEPKTYGLEGRCSIQLSYRTECHLILTVQR